MSDVVISAEEVSKRYFIRHEERKAGGFRGMMARAFRAPTIAEGGGAPNSNSRREDFWALRDVSFQVRSGEVLGVVGRNGAGKSTLLKVLSRIVEPTAGRVRILGRVSSLLEVGTGFHPELTGRENIYLNGAILGMSQAEIRRKFDEIVAFSQIERFLDTPVKRYSSGMYVRLAFAVAAHLEPEILIVDEVLAVGDAEFQKRCLNRMGDVARSGRTVLLVSHSMQAITRLCSRCVLMENGKVKLEGPAAQIANAYLNSGGAAGPVREFTDAAKAPGDEVVRLRAVRVVGTDGKPTETFDVRRSVDIEIEFEVLESGYTVLPSFDLLNEGGTRLFASMDLDSDWRRRPRAIGRYVSTASLPGNFLAEGLFSVGPSIMTLNPERTRAEFPDAVAFRVMDCLDASDTSRGDYSRPVPGMLRPMLRWTTRFSPLHVEVESSECVQR